MQDMIQINEKIFHTTKTLHIVNEKRAEPTNSKINIQSDTNRFKCNFTNKL